MSSMPVLPGTAAGGCMVWHLQRRQRAELAPHLQVIGVPGSLPRGKSQAAESQARRAGWPGLDRQLHGR